jgi:hypothetical protein
MSFYTSIHKAFHHGESDELLNETCKSSAKDLELVASSATSCDPRVPDIQRLSVHAPIQESPPCCYSHIRLTHEGKHCSNLE